MAKNRPFQNSDFDHVTKGLFELIVPLVLLVHKVQKVVKVFLVLQKTFRQLFVPYERVKLVVQ